MMEKILSQHTNRKAIVYLRQSTLKQVYEHRESTNRQYGLRERAIDLGWSEKLVEVIDDDLGQSGTCTDSRFGFQHLAEEVAQGRVGAVFALEVSRLARSSTDWHRLLDLCGLADVLIADDQGVYSPRDYNDRLLLGLKGQFADAELYWMRLRLQGGKMHKARRGELRCTPPPGYEWDPSERRLRLDPDEHVQRAIRLVFERFRIDGTANAVTQYFVRNKLQIPARDLSTNRIRWISPRTGAIRNILRNPSYAGAYVFGRHEQRASLVNGQVRRQCATLPQEQWKVCIRGRHPEFIAWEEFMTNQQKLHDNRSVKKVAGHPGAPRKGKSLLQGIVVCGKCGLGMGVRYRDCRRVDRYVRYECSNRSKRVGSGREVCWRVPAHAIDEAVEQLFLEAVQPPEVELGLATIREMERQGAETDRQWKLRIERAEYDVRIAERRYKAVDPDNRIVARSLEREWNDKLVELENLNSEYEHVRLREKFEITDEDRKRVLALSRDLPKVWRASTTTNGERKNLLRMLIKVVVLRPIDVPYRATKVHVTWQTGASSELVVPHVRKDREWTPATATDIICKRAETGTSDGDIAAELNERGLCTGRGHPWTESRVRFIRLRNGLFRQAPHRDRLSPRPSDGMYSVRGAAAQLGVDEATLRAWVRKGLLRPASEESEGVLWFNLDAATRAHLRTIRSGSKSAKSARS